MCSEWHTMLRKAAVKYLMGLSDEEFAMIVGKCRLLRIIRRDGVEEAKNSYSFIVTSHLVEQSKTK